MESPIGVYGDNEDSAEEIHGSERREAQIDEGEDFGEQALEIPGSLINEEGYE